MSDAVPLIELGAQEYRELLWLDAHKFQELGTQSLFWSPCTQWDSEMQRMMMLDGEDTEPEMGAISPVVLTAIFMRQKSLAPATLVENTLEHTLWTRVDARLAEANKEFEELLAGPGTWTVSHAPVF